MASPIDWLASSDDFSMIEKVELCGLLGGAKSVVRVCRRVRNIERFQRAIERLGLSLVESGLVFVATHRSDSEQIFGSSARVPSSAGGLRIRYVTNRGCEWLADELAELEADAGNDIDIGDRLGIPACCCATYEKIATDLNWIDRLLESTDLRRASFMACNQFVREYLGASLRPDYFPCSLQCTRTRDIGYVYRSLVETFAGRDFLEDLEFLCSRPVKLGRRLSSIEGGVNTTIPVGSKKHNGRVIFFS